MWNLNLIHNTCTHFHHSVTPLTLNIFSCAWIRKHKAENLCINQRSSQKPMIMEDLHWSAAQMDKQLIVHLRNLTLNRGMVKATPWLNKYYKKFNLGFTTSLIYHLWKWRMAYRSLFNKKTVKYVKYFVNLTPDLSWLSLSDSAKKKEQKFQCLSIQAVKNIPQKICQL